MQQRNNTNYASVCQLFTSEAIFYKGVCLAWLPKVGNRHSKKWLQWSTSSSGNCTDRSRGLILLTDVKRYMHPWRSTVYYKLQCTVNFFTLLSMFSFPYFKENHAYWFWLKCFTQATAKTWWHSLEKKLGCLANKLTMSNSSIFHTCASCKWW